MQNFTDPELVKGTTPAVDAVDHINYTYQDTLIEDGSGDGEGLRLLRIALDGSTTVIAEGRVPERDGDPRTWKATVHIDIKQSPPVPLTPVVDLVAPEEVAPDDAITLQGSHLPASIDDCHVTVDGIDAEVIFSSSMEIIAVCPIGVSPPNVRKFIVVEDLSSGLSTSVLSDPPTPSEPEIAVTIVKPKIDTSGGVDPTSGRVSTEVVISGIGFSVEPTHDAVSFNGSAAVYPSSPANAGTEQVKVNVPKDAVTGSVTITVGGNASLASSETFTRTNHNVTGYTPASAQVGDPVTINGTNFSDVIADHIVKFNSNKTATITAATSTTLTTTVPVGAITGTVSVAIGPISDTGPSFTVLP